ncbi:TPA: hypothetical protein NKP18_004432 [Vibrio parahaemolyticus]|nr:hypothetical protein [Vibrio parahaemolyticus]
MPEQINEKKQQWNSGFEQWIKVFREGVVACLPLLILLAIGGTIIAFADKQMEFNLEKIALAMKTMLGENYGFYSQSSAGIALCIANILYLWSPSDSKIEKMFDNTRNIIMVYLVALFSSLFILGFFGLEEDIPIIAWVIFIVGSLLQIVCTELNQRGKHYHGMILSFVFGVVILQPWKWLS